MAEQVEVFYSYSHKDEELRKKLNDHLVILKRRGIITNWHDRNIDAGEDWANQINAHINTANIILLLISESFLASDYCYNIEMGQALERHRKEEAVVIPILLRPVHWKGAEFAHLQSLPTDAKAVTTWSNIDLAFTNVAEGIEKAIEVWKIRHHKDSTPVPPEVRVRPRWVIRNTYESGYFSKIDSIHVHIDGGTAHGLIQRIVGTLNYEKMPSKLTAIDHAIKGPQRDIYPETYNEHTPGSGKDDEQLDYFSTTLLVDNPIHSPDMYRFAKKKLKQVLAELSDQKGIVIEAERVIGKLGDKAEWSTIPVHDFQAINQNDVGFESKRTMSIEIHHAIDIPKEGLWTEKLPLDLTLLRDACTRKGISLGGWFLFDKGNLWAYRSNSFTEFITQIEVEEERNIIVNYLSSLCSKQKFTYKVKSLVEQSLGVWKTPLERAYPFKTIQELAEWEEHNSKLRKFWVVAPNFLGDKKYEVRRAMIKNLRNGVEYTYFLDSFADFQRLRKLAKGLEEDLRSEIDKLMNAFLLVDIKSKEEFIKECFIANPHLQEWQGYKLVRDKETGEISEGKSMCSSEVEKIVNELMPLTEKSLIRQWKRIPIQAVEIAQNRVIICTEIEGCTKRRELIEAIDWENILEEYDFIIAEEVSKRGGVVLKSINDGYSIMFEEAESTVVQALQCAEQLQRALRKYNIEKSLNSSEQVILRQKVVLDYIYGSRIIRAYGYDLPNYALKRLQILLKWTEYNKIYMTKELYTLAAKKMSRSWMKTYIVPLIYKSTDEINWKDYYELKWEKE